MPDHVHMLLSIPLKYSVAQVVGFIKGKSAINIARTFSGHKKNFTGQHFWARGYYECTVGRDERAVREYIKTQGAEDLRLDQLDLFRIVATSRWVVVIIAFSGSHFQVSGLAGGMVTSKTAMGVNGGLYPDLAKKRHNAQ